MSTPLPTPLITPLITPPVEATRDRLRRLPNWLREPLLHFIVLAHCCSRSTMCW